MTASLWIQILIVGALAGAIGQGLRSIVGISKLNRVANATAPSHEDIFRLSRLLSSLAIGATAGALAAITSGADPSNISTTSFMAFVSAGYAGADFIEGTMQKVISNNGNANSHEIDDYQG